MIEPLKPKFSLKMAELQDGDIICFQKTFEPKEQTPSDGPAQEP
jgi:ubiquitin carboxyl-terminal hydrolase 7